jgi:uncharacterized membrane protein YfcA
VYLVLLAALTVWSTVDDARKGRPAFRLCVDAAAVTVLGVLFAAYFLPAFGARLGRAALPLFVVAFVWTGVTTQRDINRMEPEPQLSPRANLLVEHLGIFLAVLAASPAIAFGALAALRHW